MNELYSEQSMTQIYNMKGTYLRDLNSDASP